MALRAGLLRRAYGRIIGLHPRVLRLVYHAEREDPDTGGRQIIDTVYGPFRGLVERYGETGLARLVAGMAGERESGLDYVLVAPPEAALAAGDYTNVDASLTVPGLGRFRVRDVWPGEAEGEVCGYVCRLEQIA